jgi:hypothetical protein
MLLNQANSEVHVTIAYLKYTYYATLPHSCIVLHIFGKPIYNLIPFLILTLWLVGQCLSF